MIGSKFEYERLLSPQIKKEAGWNELAPVACRASSIESENRRII